MAKIKQIGMAAGTFSAALGIGFIMQNGDALASRFGTDNAPDTRATFAAEAPVVEASLEVTSDDVAQPVQDAVAFAVEPAMTAPEVVTDELVILSKEAQAPDMVEVPVLLARAEPDVMPDVPVDTHSDVTVANEVDCVPTMVAVPGNGATVALAVSAPCHADTAFTIHHQGMMFTAMTDEDGVSKLTVPALAEVAVMIAAFDDGDGAVSTTTVPDFTDYDRAVLQWQGDAAVMLSAYEDGSDYGDPNHIHATNTGDMDRLVAAEGGYLMRLGDASAEDALMAEVYTFPSGRMGDAFDVLLVAEAEITDTNCGQELSAQSLQVSPTGETSALDLVMVMPDCDAVGDFLILQNMFQDLTLASR